MGIEREDLGKGDGVVAIQEWLTDDPDLMEATSDGIYGHRLPDDVASSMPKAAVVVQDAGGFEEGMPEVLDRGRYDIRSYGATVDEAKRVAVLVSRRMRAIRREVRNEMVIHAASRAGGWIPLEEPPHRWPLYLRSYEIPIDVREVATP